MRAATRVFADTLYWIAIVKPGDPWGDAAKDARRKLGREISLITTDEVVTEFLTALGAGGAHLREKAVKMVRAIHANPNVKVLPQSRETFLEGLDLYSKRPDKEYSLTDCVSMNAMRRKRIKQALTNDHHFTQEGFEVLIKKKN